MPSSLASFDLNHDIEVIATAFSRNAQDTLAFLDPEEFIAAGLLGRLILGFLALHNTGDFEHRVGQGRIKVNQIKGSYKIAFKRRRRGQYLLA
jgi:hypothetical protein